MSHINKSNTSKEFGTIENFLLNGKRTTLLGNRLYFYITVNENEVMQDKFYSIDLVKDELTHISDDELSSHIIPVATFNEQVIILKSDYTENNNSGTTNLIAYKPTTREEKVVVARQVDYERIDGEVISAAMILTLF